ncbi:MAG: FkbM family methyltransferase [Bacteroidota bacterium]
MKLIYNRAVNKLVVSALRPFAKVLPGILKVPINGSFRLDLENNQSVVINANPTNYLSKMIFWDGIQGYEYNAIKVFRELAKTSRNFFDIGSNIGYYSLTASAYNNNIQIYCFEPMQSIHKYLKMNIESNNIKHATLENVGLSNQVGKVKFYSIKRDNFSEFEDQLSGEGTINLELLPGRNIQEIEINTITLDDYVKTNSIKFIDLIKMDTEASEHLVLEGSQKVLEEFKPIIFCEVLPNQVELKIEAILKKYNYQFYRIYLDKLKKVDSLVNNEDTERDYLFIHPDKLSQIKNFKII